MACFGTLLIAIPACLMFMVIPWCIEYYALNPALAPQVDWDLFYGVLFSFIPVGLAVLLRSIGFMNSAQREEPTLDEKYRPPIRVGGQPPVNKSSDEVVADLINPAGGGQLGGFVFWFCMIGIVIIALWALGFHFVEWVLDVANGVY